MVCWVGPVNCNHSWASIPMVHYASHFFIIRVLYRYMVACVLKVVNEMSGIR